MTALLLSLNDSWPKTTCKWRLLPIIISQLVWTYRLSLTSQSSSFAPVSVLVSMVSSVFVLVSPVSPFSASDSSYTAFTIYCDDHSSLSSSTAVQKWIISYTSHHFTPHGRYELNKLTSLPMCGFIAQLVEQSRWSPDFFQASSFQLLKLENLLQWSFFTFIFNRSSEMNYFIYFTFTLVIHITIIIPLCVLMLCIKGQSISFHVSFKTTC